ncbi:MAG: NAD(P)-dependent oxidoreductase, partial [Candidatus Lokiarchaeota archaeon]|nr:NAD(P)-dependent oxidoreductase [Candidatus Lokiarchaeota archaeon]
FLTGGTGFIGSHVLKELSDKGHEITVLARNPGKAPKLHDLPKVSIVEGSITDYDVIETQLKDKDACVHIALGPGSSAMEWLHNDTVPSVFLFSKAAELGVKKFIYTSSTASIGDYRKPMNIKSPFTPFEYYGATKAASETYFHATSRNSNMNCNIIRPGYTFGNPVVQGASIEPDRRFVDIVKKAKKNDTIELMKNDGTQFICADDLAQLYSSLLESEKNRAIYFGLGKNFYTWEQIARETIKLTNSSSQIVLKDKGYSDKPVMIDVSNMRNDFDLEFDSWQKIIEHLRYLISL